MAQSQLAEINVAKMRGVNIDDPIMKEFVDNLDKVNALAESSPGFIWRLKDDAGDATSYNPYDDEQIIINISVWKNIESLKHFVYKTFHTDFVKRRKEWFTLYGRVHTAMWWVNQGEYPTIDESVSRLDHLQKNGASSYVFDFKHPIKAPQV